MYKLRIGGVSKELKGHIHCAEFNDGVLQVTMQAPAREAQKRLLEIKQGEETAKAKAAAAK